MKRLGALLCAVLMVCMMAAPAASAAGLNITKASPGDGTKGVPLENMSVKLFFDKQVYSKEYLDQNREAFRLVDADGKEIPTRVIFNQKDKNVALVLAETVDADGKAVTIEPVTEYTLYIDESFTAADGSTLGKDDKITFETLNPSTTMKISFGMMAVMMVGMVFASSKAMKKQQEEQKKEKNKEEKFNPYKVAKETGKSVEEVLAEEKKRREREEKKEERKAKLHHRKEEEIEEEEDFIIPGHYRVKRVRTVAEGGSSYITGRKAEAEKKAAIEEKIRAAKAAGKKGKGKSKKKR